MVADSNSSVTTMYATKRRRRSVKAVKPPMKDPPKSNPSKRHRERLNGELDHLASLLPFEQSVISKLDKLSILRLAVSYLRTKTYFQVALNERYALDGHHPHHLVSHNHHHLFSEPSFTDTDSVLQALSGFLFVVACDGEVFFSSKTVEQYLGFHQSDIVHQSALELIHSEDREDFKSQLNWRSQLTNDQADMTLQQVLMPENNEVLQRCFTVRFRCLLDNTSGFITLELSGCIKVLHGQSLKGEEPPLALFAICCPFGPLPLLDVPPRDYTFKSKHKMDMAPLSMDPRGKLLFGYSDRELMDKGGYDLLHPDDLSYYAAAHQELIKTGSSGLIAYRLQSKDFRWIWLQTSSKVVYKNSKPDFVICTHRHLTEDEGRDLVGKRGSEFKLPYPIIDTDPTGLGASFEEEDVSKLKSQRNKKSKTQLRDYLQAARKRKTPYREVYTGLNGYTPYTGINGYSACQAGEMKTEFMYPYAGNNFALDTDIYRAGYPFTGSVYPGTDSFRLEADKHGYTTNGYYLEPRQYQHTLQYHGNGYTDLVSQSSKYTYDMSKYGYDMSSYGLDLTKSRQYDADLTRYETDLRKYDYGVDKLSRVNGTTYDSLRSSSFYGTNPMLNNESLLSCNVSQNTTTSCSLYRSDHGSTDATDRYNQNMSKEAAKYGVSTTPSVIDNNSDCKPNLANGHTSVIRNTSQQQQPQQQQQRNKTPPTDHHALSGALYTAESGTNGVLANCASSAWNVPCTKSMEASYKDSGMHSGSSNASQSPLQPLTPADVSAHIVSPSSKPVDENTSLSMNNSSPALASTATSVIQMSGRPRSTCDKQSPVTGGIAVPVVKSSAWLHHIPSTPSYDWHLGSTDSYSCHQRALRNSSTDSYYSSVEPSVAAAHTRAIVEAPKYVSVKPGENNNNPESNPLLTFSEVTHTLLSNG